MARFSEADLLVKALIAGTLAVCLVMSLIFWRLRADDRAAQQTVLPQCIARLGSARDCEDRFTQHHQQCFRYTHQTNSKYGARSFDEKGYLDCVIAGPEAWLAAEREARQRVERQNCVDGVRVP